MALLFCLQAQRPAIIQNPHVLLHTQAGDIELEIDAAHAPMTAANFMRYVQGGFYTGGSFHRTVTPQNQPENAIRIQVIQAGINPARNAGAFPAIPLERTNITGLHHRDGTLSMARGASPDSASSDIFICVGEQPSLDFGGRRNPDGQGFAAFGQVVRGMDVVRRIQHLPHDQQKLTPPISIASADVLNP